jgi:hypothetical protein
VTATSACWNRRPPDPATTALIDAQTVCKIERYLRRQKQALSDYEQALTSGILLDAILAVRDGRRAS